MAKLSDIVLNLNVPREACPLNLAPTASTTAALAVGDAIAVALMKLKNISESDFARRHPGGQLGLRVQTVEHVMRKGDENPVIPVDKTTREMLAQITAFRVGAISVINDAGELLGLVTDYDIRNALLESGRDLLSLNIADIMNPAPHVAFSDEKAIDALEKMKVGRKPTAVLPVIDRSRKVVGMIHLHDLVSAGL